jgi:hypothetical protein
MCGIAGVIDYRRPALPLAARLDAALVSRS